MNKELLLLLKKHTDSLIEQKKIRPQETLEFRMNKQMQTFSFNPPVNLAEECKRLLAVTSFDATNSVFNITDKNNSFSFSTPGHWISEDGEQLFNKLNKILELRSENDIELKVKEIRERGNQVKIGENEKLRLSHLDTCKNLMIKELKRVKYKDLEDMIYRLEVTYDEIVHTLDVKYISGSTFGYILQVGVYEITDINLMLKCLLPEVVKVTITFDDIRLRSYLTTNKTTRFTKKFFFYTISGFIQSYSRDFGDIEGFIQLIPG